jgi:predicted DsbA family dithiol-disulfide isomerase
MQGKFWEVHRLFFARQKDLSQRFWQDDAKTIGLTSATLAGCLDGAALKRVRDDIAEGRRLGVNSTPTFVIGVIQPDGKVSVRTRIQGAQPYEVFEKAIKASL